MPFKETRTKVNNVFNNLEYLSNNNLDYTPRKRDSIYNIKQAYKIYNPYYSNYKNNIKTKNNNYFYLYSILNETNDFYSSHIKSGIAKTMSERISARVLDDYEIVSNDDKERKITQDINIYNKKYKYKMNNDFFDFSDIVKNLIWYSKIYILLVKEEDKISFKSIPPFRIDKINKEYYYKYEFNGDAYYKIYNEKTIKTYKIERGKSEYISIEDNQFGFMPIIEMSLGSEITNISTTENILMFSEALTLLQKEIKTSSHQVFLSKEYIKNNSLINSHFVVVNTPKVEYKMTDAPKPLYEVYSPEIRTDQINNLLDKCKDNISQNMQMDKSTLGLDNNTSTQTATESKINSTTSMETINKIKKDVQIQLNKLFSYITKDKYKIVINPYSYEDKKAELDIYTQELNNGFIDYEEAVRLSHPEYSDKEIKETYLTILYRKGIPITQKERKEMKKLGIIPTNNFEEVEGSINDPNDNGSVL